MRGVRNGSVFSDERGRNEGCVKMVCRFEGGLFFRIEWGEEGFVVVNEDEGLRVEGRMGEGV
jgi:hypothetical protein